MNNKLLGPIMLIVGLVLLALSAQYAEAAERERDYQERYCSGLMEYVLDDRTRVDCLTNDHAIEYDWARKAPEALGQALYYAAKTGKKPGIVLIFKDPKDQRFLNRLYFTLDAWQLRDKVTVWKVGAIE